MPGDLLKPGPAHTSPWNEEDQPEVARTFGERTADAITSWFASWGAFWWHFAIFLGWMLWNGIPFTGHAHFDPFPYIFLNLFLSTEAAISTVFIMMSTYRGDQRAKAVQEEIRRVSLRTEALAVHLDQELDRLADNQKTVVDLLEEIKRKPN
jgi:uncharacterized membrane protein